MLSKLVMRIRSQRGDTIIEVLIAIAVISLVLGGAYATTNRSLLATRGAEERVTGLKLIETQVELIKGMAKSNPTTLFGAATPNPFCINNSGTLVSATAPDCKVDAGNTPTTAQPQFTLSTTRSGNTFTVTSQWTDIRGRITDKARMIYRVYD